MKRQTKFGWLDYQRADDWEDRHPWISALLMAAILFVFALLWFLTPP